MVSAARVTTQRQTSMTVSSRLFYLASSWLWWFYSPRQVINVSQHEKTWVPVWGTFWFSIYLHTMLQEPLKRWHLRLLFLTKHCSNVDSSAVLVHVNCWYATAWNERQWHRNTRVHKEMPTCIEADRCLEQTVRGPCASDTPSMPNGDVDVETWRGDGNGLYTSQSKPTAEELAHCCNPPQMELNKIVPPRSPQRQWERLQIWTVRWQQCPRRRMQSCDTYSIIVQTSRTSSRDGFHTFLWSSGANVWITSSAAFHEDVIPGPTEQLYHKQQT